MTWIIGTLTIFIGWAVWSIRSTIKNELSDFRERLMRDLDDRFVDSKVCHSEMNAIRNDVTGLDTRVTTIEKHIFRQHSSQTKS